MWDICPNYGGGYTPVFPQSEIAPYEKLFVFNGLRLLVERHSVCITSGMHSTAKASAMKARPITIETAAMLPPRTATSLQAVAQGATTADDDTALVARCIDGDNRAWATLVQRYQRLVFAIVTRMGLDEHAAADVFQTVFSRLFEQLPRIAEPSRLQAWIVTTAKREGLLQRKRGQRLVSMTNDDEGGDGAEWDLADESPIAEEVLSDLQQLNVLRNALEQLDERSRAVVLLLFRDEEDALSYEEVARRLGTSIGSIGPTRARCLEKLRRLIKLQ